MYSANNYNSEQNYFYCRNNCGVKITFCDDVISKNGKLIPIQENGLRHDCPNSPYNKARAIAVEKRKTRKEQEFQTINVTKRPDSECQQEALELSVETCSDRERGDLK